MIDQDTNAAKNFYRMVRDFAQRTKPWEQAIFYETKPDEVWDLSLASQRVYGRRDEFMVIAAAAGLDAFDRPLEQQRLILPNEGQLYALKRRAGFETRGDYREGGKPTWMAD